ncbi:MAG: DUF3467 domain-containing protein [Planctomycetota bacterium]
MVDKRFEPAGAGEPDSQSQQARLQIRDTGAQTSYANFFLVSTTPEEVVLSFGINLLPPSKERELRVDISNRVVLGYVSAKRLAITLSNVIQRFEAEHGVIEVDARRKPSPGTDPSAG